MQESATQGTSCYAEGSSLFQGGQQSSPQGNFTSLLSPCPHPLLFNTRAAADAWMAKRDHDSALEKCASDKCLRVILGAWETTATDTSVRPQWLPSDKGQRAGSWTRAGGQGCHEQQGAASSLTHLPSQSRLKRSGYS